MGHTKSFYKASGKQVQNSFRSPCCTRQNKSKHEDMQEVGTGMKPVAKHVAAIDEDGIHIRSASTCMSLAIVFSSHNNEPCKKSFWCHLSAQIGM